MFHGITVFTLLTLLRRTLDRIAGARKPILNGWLIGNITVEPGMVYGGPTRLD
jgi:hypothetical protein